MIVDLKCLIVFQVQLVMSFPWGPKVVEKLLLLPLIPQAMEKMIEKVQEQYMAGGLMTMVLASTHSLKFTMMPWIKLY